MEKKYIESAKRLMDMLEKSPSQFHVIDNISKLLDANGFLFLDEKKPFGLERGKSYYTTRNNTSIIAFRVPEDFDGINVVAAHTDSPTFRIKANPEVKASGLPTRLNVEGYGGMLMAPWFDRPLSIAGRVFVKEDGKINEKLVDFGSSCDEIVNLAIHQNREANNGMKYSVQNDLLPLFSDSDSNIEFDAAVAEKAGVKKEDILSYDLFLYNRQKPEFIGMDEAFFSASRIDDLECAYTAIEGLINSKPENKIAMVSLFDNEEVGSGTKQGALSDFLQNTVSRIYLSLGLTEEEKYMHIASSRMLSADNAHAVHPAYTGKSDITNKPRMNGGIVIKYSANQKYTTDAETGAFTKNLLDENEIPNQYFFNNSDVTGGSTLGNLSSWKISIRSCDIGCAQLAMHSPYETAGTKDVYYMEKLFTKFLSL